MSISEREVYVEEYDELKKKHTKEPKITINTLTFHLGTRCQ